MGKPNDMGGISRLSLVQNAGGVHTFITGFQAWSSLCSKAAGYSAALLFVADRIRPTVPDRGEGEKAPAIKKRESEKDKSRRTMILKSKFIKGNIQKNEAFLQTAFTAGLPGEGRAIIVSILLWDLPKPLVYERP